MALARFLDPAVRRVIRRVVCRGICHVLRLAALGLAVPTLAARAETAQCDYSGFEKPCKAGEGEYRVLIPEGEGPFPAMVYLYGSGGRSVTIASHPLFEAAVAGRGYALIVPAAKEMTYVGGVRDTGWSLGNEPGQGRDEVAFLRAVIADAVRRFPLDSDRILLAGQSRGGFLIWEIACHEPGLASAYAVHGAGYLGALPEACAQPVRFLHGHGRADLVVPIAGRPGRRGGLEIPPLFETLGLMQRTDGCEDDPGAPSPDLDFQRLSWSGCAAGSRLDLLLHDGGHAMPASWFRAVLDWFEEPLPEPAETVPVVRHIGEGLPAGGADTHAAAQPGVRPAGHFKAPPAPGKRAFAIE